MLADDVLMFFVKLNETDLKSLIKYLKKNYPNDIEDDIYFNFNDGYKLSYITNETIPKYKRLNPFINIHELYIVFKRFMSAEGVYSKDKNTIYLKFNVCSGYCFIRCLIGWYDNDKRYSFVGVTDSSTESLFRLMQHFFRDTLIHELQHAFDDYRSHGQYSQNKKSAQYQKNLKYNPFNTEASLTPEERKIYLSLPHEYWARFSAFVNGMNFKGDRAYDTDFNHLFRIFEMFFEGWRTLDEKDQKRLIKALYKYNEFLKEKENNL